MLLSSQLIAMVATTAVAILLARSLGPSEWGLFSALLGLSLALSTFVDLGLGTWLLRELSTATSGIASEGGAPPATPNIDSMHLSSAVAANALIGGLLLAGTLVVLAVSGTTSSTSAALLGLMMYTVLLAASNCLESLYRAKRRLKTVVVAVVLEKFLLLSCIVAVVLLDYGLWSIGLAYIVAGAGRLTFVTTSLLGRIGFRFSRPAMPDIGRVARAGVPFAFGTVALNVIPRLDTLLVALVSTTAAGYFALGDRVIGPALIVPVVASAALYPFFSREGSEVGDAWRISAGMFAAGAAIATIGALLAPLLVPAVFGAQYEQAIGVVQIMCFVLPFLYASNPLLARLYTAGRERQVLATTVVASLGGTAAIIIGQLTVGPTGAAVGYLLRHVLFTVVLSALCAALVKSTRSDWGLTDASGGAPVEASIRIHRDV